MSCDAISCPIRCDSPHHSTHPSSQPGLELVPQARATTQHVPQHSGWSGNWFPTCTSDHVQMTRLEPEPTALAPGQACLNTNTYLTNSHGNKDTAKTHFKNNVRLSEVIECSKSARRDALSWIIATNYVVVALNPARSLTTEVRNTFLTNCLQNSS